MLPGRRDRTRRIWIGTALGVGVWVVIGAVLTFAPSVFKAITAAVGVLVVIAFVLNARRWSQRDAGTAGLQPRVESVDDLPELPIGPRVFHSPLDVVEARERLRGKVSLAQLIWHLTGTMNIDGVTGTFVGGRLWGEVRPASGSVQRRPVGVRGLIESNPAGGTDFTLVFALGGAWLGSEEVEERRYLRMWLQEVFTDLCIEEPPPTV